MKLVILFLFAISLYSENALSIEKGTTISVCEDEGEWPPYEYLQRDNGKKTDKVAGYNIDILDEIFSNNQLTYKVTMMPWKRCLNEVKNGQHYMMLLPTSLNSDRKKSLLVTRHNYVITPSYFYLKKRFPKKIQIKTAKELLEYGRICGRHGYNYVNFGFKNEQVHRRAHTYKAAFQMLIIERCDILLARYEIVTGFPLIGGEKLVTSEIAFAPIPDISSEKFYFMISKNYQYSTDLLKIINNGIIQLEKQGKLQSLMNKYLP